MSVQNIEQLLWGGETAKAVANLPAAGAGGHPNDRSPPRWTCAAGSAPGGG